MDDPSDAFGAASVVVFLAMFGGSTFILFLLCYFCQKKIHNEDLTVMEQGITHQVYVIPTTNQTFQNVPAMPSPPPDYNSVIKKDLVFEFEADPPSYDTAVASLSTGKCKSSTQLPESCTS